MTLLSFVAIIASALAGCGFYLAYDGDWRFVRKQEQEPKWKSILWQIHCWCYFGDISSRRRFWLKLVLSLLIVIAFGCGFWDEYSTNAPEHRDFWYVLLSFFLSAASFGIVFIIFRVGIYDFKNLIRERRLNFRRGSLKAMAVNIAYLCVWVAMFIFLVCLGLSTVFNLISISIVLAAGLALLLTLLGYCIWGICWMFWGIIIRPLIAYIDWLRK